MTLRQLSQDGRIRVKSDSNTSCARLQFHYGSYPGGMIFYDRGAPSPMVTTQAPETLIARIASAKTFYHQDSWTARTG